MKALTGRPDDVLDEIIDRVEAVDADEDVVEFYVGRTSDLDKRRAEHGADDILALYRTDSDEYALAVEEALITEFIDREKCSNEADHAGGGVSPEYSSYVYVAVWYANEEG